MLNTSSGGDCANFVSQCLAAGGLENDPLDTSLRDTNNSTTQWWHSRVGTTNTSPRTWRGAISFVNYWGARYSVVSIASDLSNVYPGNPIITSTGGHVAICVGRNGSTPLISSHTSDMNSVPMNRDWIGDGADEYGKTILILTGYCSSGHTSGSYKNNTMWHWRTCTACNAAATTPVAHTYSYDGTYYTCTVCSYKTIVTPVQPRSLASNYYKELTAA